VKPRGKRSCRRPSDQRTGPPLRRSRGEASPHQPLTGRIPIRGSLQIGSGSERRAIPVIGGPNFGARKAAALDSEQMASFGKIHIPGDKVMDASRTEWRRALKAHISIIPRLGIRSKDAPVPTGKIPSSQIPDRNQMDLYSHSAGNSLYRQFVRRIIKHNIHQ
jgi:hypothetical protein